MGKDGKELDLVKWGDKYYTQTSLLHQISGNLFSKYPIYTAVEGSIGQDGYGVTYSPLSTTDLEYVSASSITGLNQDIPEMAVFAQLTPVALAKTWYMKASDGSYSQISDSELAVIQSYLINDIGWILNWKEGTYYYINILHLGAEGYPGYTGIVRNHIYNVILSGISGFGTPVFDPDEIIIPTTPPHETYNINAEVKILQWRVVSQEYNINW